MPIRAANTEVWGPCAATPGRRLQHDRRIFENGYLQWIEKPYALESIDLRWQIDDAHTTLTAAVEARVPADATAVLGEPPVHERSRPEGLISGLHILVLLLHYTSIPVFLASPDNCHLVSDYWNRY